MLLLQYPACLTQRTICHFCPACLTQRTICHVLRNEQSVTCFCPRQKRYHGSIKSFSFLNDALHHHGPAVISFSVLLCFHEMVDRNNERKHIELHEVAVLGFCAGGDVACMSMDFTNVLVLLYFFSCIKFYKVVGLLSNAVRYLLRPMFCDVACSTCKSIILVIKIKLQSKQASHP